MLTLVGKALAVDFPDLKNWIVPTSTNLGTLAGRLVDFALLAAGIIAVAFLIYGGIMYITAGGDTAKAEKGRTAVVNAIIGIVIILLAFVIVTWVGKIIKKGNTNPDTPSVFTFIVPVDRAS
jgi:uncharacterized RDD family membrane protein YckC